MACTAVRAVSLRVRQSVRPVVHLHQIKAQTVTVTADGAAAAAAAAVVAVMSSVATQEEAKSWSQVLRTWRIHVSGCGTCRLGAATLGHQS